MCKYGGNVIKLCKEDNCKECHEKSFASQEKAQYWDYEKNDDVKPRDVFKSSHKNYSFVCQTCLHGFASPLNAIVRGQWCPYCANCKLCDDVDCRICYVKSFAPHPKATFWDFEKNGNLKPRDVFMKSNKRYFLKCEVCFHTFDVNLSSVVKGGWCPYCANKRLCDDQQCKMCNEKSFASHENAQFWDYEKNGNITPRDAYKNCHKNYSFVCKTCLHCFASSLNAVVKGQWCPYCISSKLCGDVDCNLCYTRSFASHDKAQFWDYSKNGDVTPRFIFKSSQTRRWFICETCRCSFQTRPGHVVCGSWCPMCKNKTEKLVFQTLKQKYPDIIHQAKFDWCKNVKHLPFDMMIPSKNTIIEIDGCQHFEQISNWYPTDEVQKRDIFKMHKANENGYRIIRIVQKDILNKDFDWYERLVETIEIKTDNIIFLSIDNDKYDTYKQILCE